VRVAVVAGTARLCRDDLEVAADEVDDSAEVAAPVPGRAAAAEVAAARPHPGGGL
jgi:hypothetical protein